MNLLVGAVCLALTVSAVEITIKPEDNPVFNYHTRFGIPAAIRIQQSELARISGGTINDVSETPYQAGLIVQILPIFSSVCGAVLISSAHLLTAAHCQYDGVFNAQYFTVVLGSNTLFSGGVRIVTSDVVLHPDYNANTIANDIAVIRVSPVDFSDCIQPIDLPNSSEILQNFVGWVAVASGYGITVPGGGVPNNQPISSVTLPVISNFECNLVFGSFVRATNLCTSGVGGKGTCSGDSGGPLVVKLQHRSFLIGVVSFGSSAGCGSGFPTAFSRVTSYIDWILSHIKQ